MLLLSNGPVLQVKALRQARVGLVITGNEVYHGLIQDRFTPVLTEKVKGLRSKGTPLILPQRVPT